MALEREYATYKRMLPELLAHEGKFVLIHEDDAVDFFCTYEDAIRTGYQKFGLAPFFVKRILAVEPVHVISRLLQPGLVTPVA